MYNNIKLLRGKIMKYNDISKIHKATLAIGVGAFFVATASHPDLVHRSLSISEQLDVESLSKEYRDLFDTIILGGIPYISSMFMTDFLEHITEEYKVLNGEYYKVIKKFSELCDELKLTDPIDIYVLFVYMYRSGYLSVNHIFNYDMDMKDLSNLLGVDIIRGHGVCRSISSMLNDIYRFRNIDSSTLVVCAKNLSQIERFSKAKMNATKNGRNFARVVGKLSQLIGVSNHLIVELNYNECNIKLDPTNDGIFISGSFGKIKTYTGAKTAMKKTALVRLKTMFHMLKKPEQLGKYLMSNNSCYSYEEYKKRYTNVNNIIDDNEQLLEQFYINNVDSYNFIDEISSKQKSVLKRKYL